MRDFKTFFSFCLFACVLFFSTYCFAGLIYQDFEPDNGSDIYGWAWGSTISRLSCCGEPAHFTGRSWRVESGGYYNGTGIQSQTNRWHFDAKPNRNDRLSFFIYAVPFNNTDNNVGVQFFDHGNYNTNGFEVWTTKTARYGEWTELYVLFSQLPSDFNLADIDKIQFVNYWPGTYYFDDIAVMRQDRAYQAFEPQLRSGSTVNEYGWKWNDADYAGFSAPGEPVYEGLYSWKLITTQKWGGTGLQSQEKRLLQTSQGNEQTFWHVDLNPDMNDRLILWVYALAENGLDNNLAVQFYDNGEHFTDETKAVAWTKQTAKYGQWSRLEVLFSELPATLNLRDINKIQLQVYWPGTYYFDDIRASGPLVKVDKGLLNQGTFQWAGIPEAGNYYVEESFDGPEGPWHTFWSSVDYSSWTTDIPLNRLSKTWYRIQWIEADSAAAWAYYSNWSEVAEYLPTPALIKNNRLKDGIVEWNNVVLATEYEVESALSKEGPWSRIYKGPYPNTPFAARFGEWYRVRALNAVDAADWSPAQMYAPQKGFVRAIGTALREDDGLGDEITLRGVNLGSYFLIEKWMSGLGAADTPNIEDDWTMRNILIQRFGNAEAERLLASYRDAYLRIFDFDRLMDMGVNFVRLPVYFRILQDDDGNWIRNEAGEINFEPIDWIVNACADRGIYVLLDLHGAPGAQSSEAHTGRAGFNKLFENSPEGETYRTRTVNLWQEIVLHYKDNAAVVGYDLLNEPVGAAPQKETLWSLYDRIYQVIRAVDSNHLIVMEGIWYPDPSNPDRYFVDWDTLPRPSEKGWENVMYQYHYYLWNNDDNFAAHQSYIDAKVSEAQIKQPDYQVPVMIGEFTCFSLRSIWDYYLENFTRQGWSWAVWSYKNQNFPSEWGLYTNNDYDDTLPKFRETEADGTAGDSFERLLEKIGKYDTETHHASNASLTALLKNYLLISLSLNPVGSRSTLEGQNLNFSVSSSYSGSGTLTYSASPLPEGAVFKNQQFNWTPGFNQGGIYSIEFIVTDGISTDKETVTITVINVLPRITSLSDAPDPFSPNGDKRYDTTTISAAFNHRLNWALNIKNSSGAIVRTFTGTGVNVSQVWNGKNASGSFLSSGTYTYTMKGTDTGGDSVKKSGTIVIDTIAPRIYNLTDYPDPFKPRIGQKSKVSFRLSEPAYVTIQVINRSGALVKTLVADKYVTAFSYNVSWNGKSSAGVYVPSGTYTYKIWVRDKASNRISPYPTRITVRVIS